MVGEGYAPDTRYPCKIGRPKYLDQRAMPC